MESFCLKEKRFQKMLMSATENVITIIDNKQYISLENVTLQIDQHKRSEMGKS